MRFPVPPFVRSALVLRTIFPYFFHNPLTTTVGRTHFNVFVRYVDRSSTFVSKSGKQEPCPLPVRTNERTGGVVVVFHPLPILIFPATNPSLPSHPFLTPSTVSPFELHGKDSRAADKTPRQRNGRFVCIVSSTSFTSVKIGKLPSSSSSALLAEFRSLRGWWVAWASNNDPTIMWIVVWREMIWNGMVWGCFRILI